jgi:hypothetical protein
MIKVDDDSLKNMEEQYRGIKKQIFDYDKEKLPACRFCKSSDTAQVQFGIIGRTMNIAAATTKFKLAVKSKKTKRYYCNSCSKYFS